MIPAREKVLRPAVFLDRDGTLIEEVPYLADPARVQLLPGAAEALRRWRASGFACVLVTNQSGIGRGLLSVETLQRIHDELIRQLDAEGVALDGIEYCPFAPTTGDPTVIEHFDRKPGPGMLLRASKVLGLDLSRCWMIGDTLVDLLAGHNAGCRGSVLVGTGKGLAAGEDRLAPPHDNVEDLLGAVALILEATADDNPKNVPVRPGGDSWFIRAQFMDQTLILGGGMTGLAAGLSSGWPVFEASESPGGICSSYYVEPGQRERLPKPTDDGEVYRFEIGGGHWIFGGDPTVLRFIERLAPVRRYGRRSAVYFREDDLYVDYPIQNNLRSLPPAFASQALTEMVRPAGRVATMREWLLEYFGPTLCEKFFFPFHERYTAGLQDRIAPQDAYKSPLDLNQVIRGMFEPARAMGYNVNYLYPIDGLNRLARAMAERCDLRTGRRVVQIDPRAKRVRFADGTDQPYDSLLCTLPLNQTMAMAGLSVDAEPDPYTSVLVLNIGALKGSNCPPHHWLYNPDARSGFHRVGIYSNVDVSFLPRSARADASALSLYIERAYPGGQRPSETEVETYAQSVVAELKDWGFIDRAEVVDPTWIDVAYTWQWPGSTWKARALRVLQEHDIFMVGRYARWLFQGIADSIRDGFYAGASFREFGEREKVS